MTRRDAARGRPEIMIFGRHAVEAALASGGAEVSQVVVAGGLPVPDRKRLRQLAEARGIPIEERSRDEVGRLTGATRHDQGIAARVRLLHVTHLATFVERRKGAAARLPTRLLGLDGVTNPQNVGMVVRSVVGAGLDGLLWPRIGLPWVNGLVVRAASGAIFDCPIVFCESLASGLAELHAAGFTSIGLDAHARASLFDDPPPHRAIYVLGGETEGLSGAVHGQLDRHVSIPMAGGIDSLNVAVAAGLVSFHAAGRLGARGDPGKCEPS